MVFDVIATALSGPNTSCELYIDMQMYIYIYIYIYRDGSRRTENIPPT